MPPTHHPMRATRELGRSFVYAFEGLLYTMHTQRNMRFHIFMAILVLAFNVSFSDYIPVDERALLLIVICLVPAFEIVNTSIESQADYVGADRHELIKRAKDTAAAAVLVMALTAMAVGGYVLLPNFIKFFRAPTPGRITSVGLRLIMSVTVGGSILVFWIFRSVKHLFFPTLVMASLAAGGTTAVMCIIGRDPSTAVALLFLCALELNAFARAEFEVRIHKEWVRPDLPFEVEGLKLIAPGLLLGFLGGAWVVWWGPFACYLAR